MFGLTFRTLAPTALIVLALTAVATAEPLRLDDARLELTPPTGWKVIELLNDEDAIIYAIDGSGGTIELYAIKLDRKPLSPADAVKLGDKVLRQMARIERELDLDPGPKKKIKLEGCQKTAYFSYKDGDLETHIAGCLHPDSTRQYIWRLGIDPAQKEKKEAIVQSFHRLLFKGVQVLTRPEPAPVPVDGADGGTAPSATGSPEPGGPGGANGGTVPPATGSPEPGPDGAPPGSPAKEADPPPADRAL